MATTTSSQRISHEDWMSLAATEYERLVELLRGLDATAWSAPTECPGWDVRAMVAHLCGAADGTARPLEMVRQAAVGCVRHRRAMLVDSINEVQIADRATATPSQLVAELEEAGARSVRTRGRLPERLRALVVPIGAPVGTKPVGYLTDRIYTRDAWMHRIDIARATGVPLDLDQVHDGLLVEDLVDEWAATHGRPFDLTLTGPAGVHRAVPGDGAVLELDAIEFARTLAGRERGAGLLTATVPF